MNALAVWRTAIAVLSGVSLGLNGVLVVQWFHRWRRTRDVGYAYPLAFTTIACLIGIASIYWRSYDHITARELNVGDITVLIPSIGFLLVALLGFRALTHGGKYDVAND